MLYCDFVPQSLQLIVRVNFPVPDFARAFIVTVQDPPDVSPADRADPAFLEEVSTAAVRITIADGEKKTQDVRIAR